MEKKQAGTFFNRIGIGSPQLSPFCLDFVLELAHHGAEVEFVRPVENTEFCANCNRLRITADGKLKPCLLVNNNLIDVSEAKPDELPELLLRSIDRRVPFYRDMKDKTIIGD